MTETGLQQALEEWLERALAGEEPEPELFARARGLPVDAFRERIVAARWLLERERSVAATRSLPATPQTGLPPAPDAGAARRFGRYAVLGELGRGGQAEVYLADDTVLHRRVALKVLS